MSTFKQIYDEYEKTFRQQLLDKLYELSPYDFEHFARKLLDAYGFVEVKVTQASKDGGIDGRGNLKLGLATMRAAFQCKRWQGNVGRVEVDKFRGAIQGEFEQGIFFTTGDYTKSAKQASLKRGAVPIILLNGDSIVDLMIEKELGVERVPLYIFRECLSDFMVEGDEETIDTETETDTDTDTDSPVYDMAFYKSKYNPQSVEHFYRYVKEVEDLISSKSWSLETKFNRYYCSFKVGFFNVFVIRWIGTKTFAFTVKITEDEAKQLGIPFTKYSNHRKRTYYYVDPSDTKTESMLPVFEFTYKKFMENKS